MPTQNNPPIDLGGHPHISWHGTHSLEERERIIQEAAYHLYAQRGYTHGQHEDDWLAAEASLDHGNRELPPADPVTFEKQQSNIHSVREDDAMKRVSKKQ